MACKLAGIIAIKWHKILGHARPNAIKQLPKYVNGVELAKFLINERVPLKIKYEVCLIAKYI